MWRKAFDYHEVVFFPMYPHKSVSQKCLLLVSGRDIQGHMISSPELKMTSYVWIEAKYLT